MDLGGITSEDQYPSSDKVKERNATVRNRTLYGGNRPPRPKRFVGILQLAG